MIHKNNLISSGSLMNAAINYNQFIFKKIKKYIYGTCLEVGAGTGNFSKLISEKVDKLYVADEKKESYYFLKKRLKNIKNIKLINKSLNNLNIPKVNSILLLNVLEHIKDDERAIKKLLKTLKNNSHLIIQVPAFNFLFSNYDKCVGHYKRYEKKDFLKIAKKLNLNVIEMYYFNPIGALGWWFNYCFLGKTEQKKSTTKIQIKIYDKLIVPIIKLFDSKKNIFGISLMIIIKK
jgi:ubiquinone/menaquinone biosynthesis C-methylase UbiE